MVALGGDGAFHHLVEGIRGTDVVAGFFPAGNGNDIARASGDSAAIQWRRRTLSCAGSRGRWIWCECDSAMEAWRIISAREAWGWTRKRRIWRTRDSGRGRE